MNILVTGGAGYIGSHMVKALYQAGLRPVVLDNLCNGHREAVGDTEFVQGDIGDAALLRKLFADYKFSCVMHFAALIQVAESMREPARYLENNVARSKILLEAAVQHKADVIFSSSAAVFGLPQCIPIDETHPEKPVNPYGLSKLMVEQMLKEHAYNAGLRFVSLRYFNAAGADPDGELGECHEPETHLIPLVLQVASGRRKTISIYGDNYATADGTCVRDYIHVSDLAAAHLLALRYLQKGGESRCFNLGTGRGYSVREVIKEAERVTEKTITVKMEERREGDPDSLIADGTLAKKLLGWEPKYSDLETVLIHAWAWEQRLRAKHGG